MIEKLSDDFDIFCRGIVSPSPRLIARSYAVTKDGRPSSQSALTNTTCMLSAPYSHVCQQ